MQADGADVLLGKNTSKPCFFLDNFQQSICLARRLEVAAVVNCALDDWLYKATSVVCLCSLPVHEDLLAPRSAAAFAVMQLYAGFRPEAQKAVDGPDQCHARHSCQITLELESF